MWERWYTLGRLYKLHGSPPNERRYYMVRVTVSYPSPSGITKFLVTWQDEMACKTLYTWPDMQRDPLLNTSIREMKHLNGRNNVNSRSEKRVEILPVRRKGLWYVIENKIIFLNATKYGHISLYVPTIPAYFLSFLRARNSVSKFDTSNRLGFHVLHHY